MPSSAARTLADQLRSWPDARLAALLAARPDLTVPTPQDSSQLAARVAARPSVARALDRLSVLDLAVLEAAVHLVPCATADLEAVIDAEPADVEASVQLLLEGALLWGTPDELRVVSVVADLLESASGPPVEEVARRVEELSGPARALLTHLDERDADGRTESVTEPVRELLDRRLVALRHDGRRIGVPWSVRVALRGGRSTRSPIGQPPPLALAERDRALVDRTAAGAAFELVRRTELLLEHWGTSGPAVLRTGGLAVRDLKATATLLDLSPTEAGLVVETARAAGLLAPGATDDADEAWLPTEAYDSWSARPVAERWVALARAWLVNPRLVSTIGGRDPVTDRPVNALQPDLERTWLVDVRRSALVELAELTGTDTALAAGTGLASLLARLRWSRPRGPRGREDAVASTLDEAAFVGVGALGAISSFGRTLLSDEPGADPAPELEPLLPVPVDQVLIQADLTAIAPGPLEAELSRRLSLLSDVESRGGATVYRFGADSVRRGFDAGWSSAEIKQFLADASRTPVPQALDYLVDDVARRFGTVRAGAVESFLRSDDEAALSALVADPQAASLRLRRIAPTVVVSDVPLGVLLPRLRELGQAPVVEAADGSVRVARPDVFRSRVAPSRRSAPGLDPARQAARTAALVAAVRSGDRVAASRPSGALATTPGDVLSLLRRAAEEGAEVLIDYVDNHGRRTERLVLPERVEAGQLVTEENTFAIPRISSARVV